MMSQCIPMGICLLIMDLNERIALGKHIEAMHKLFGFFNHHIMPCTCASMRRAASGKWGSS